MTDTRPLSGQAALITGGGSGIGLAAAAKLRRDGATVTLVGRSEERLRAGADELEAQPAPPGATVAWVRGDVAYEAEV